MSYQEKYLKYKNKYLKYKNKYIQLGGNKISGTYDVYINNGYERNINFYQEFEYTNDLKQKLLYYLDCTNYNIITELMDEQATVILGLPTGSNNGKIYISTNSTKSQSSMPNNLHNHSPLQQRIYYMDIIERLAQDKEYAENQRYNNITINECIAYARQKYENRIIELLTEPHWHTLEELNSMSNDKLMIILQAQYTQELFSSLSIEEIRKRLQKEFTKARSGIGWLERARLNYDIYKCKQILLENKKVVVPILGDGDCFYRATALLHYGTTNARELVKLQVIAHLHENRDLFEQAGEEIQNRLELQNRFLYQVIQPNAYAEGLIVEAFCDLYKCKIHNFNKFSITLDGIIPSVHTNGRDLYANNEGLPTICLFNYDNTNHFDAIVDLDNIDEDTDSRYQQNNTEYEHIRLTKIKQIILSYGPPVEIDKWKCAHCSANNDNSTTVCETCDEPKYGYWRCKCSGINRDDANNCHICNEPRPAAQAAPGKQKYFKLKNLALLYRK